MNIVLVLLALFILSVIAWSACQFLRLARFVIEGVMWLVCGGTSFYRAKRVK